MTKVLVVGSPGAGKSTFARALREAAGLPLYYLDTLWHKPDKTTVSKEEFDARIAELLTKEQWIIDGNYQRTLETRLRACDTAFLLDYPLETCLAGAQARVGTMREDLPWLESELDAEFKQYILDFRQTRLPKIYKLLNAYRGGRSIVVFKSRQEADAYLNTLRARP